MSDTYPDPAAEYSDPDTPQADLPAEPPEPEPLPPEPVRDPHPARTLVFEDLTLADALTYLVWRPVLTGRLLWRVLTRDDTPQAVREAEDGGPYDEGPYGGEPPPDDALFARREEEPVESPSAAPHVERGRFGFVVDGRNTLVRIAVLAAAVLLALRGGTVLRAAALDDRLKSAGDPHGAGFWFVLAGALVAGLELWVGCGWWARHLPGPAARLQRRFRANELPQMWTIGLGLPVIVLVFLAGSSEGVIVPALLLIAAVVLWITLAIGFAPPEALAVTSQTAPADAAVEDDDAPYVVRSVVRDAAPGAAARPVPAPRLWAWLGAHAYQILLIPVALVFSALTYSQNVQRDLSGRTIDVVLTGPGVIAWALSITLWIVVLGVDVRRLPDRMRAWRWPDLRRVRIGWALLAAIGVTALGAYFRLHDLSSAPPEMTSDHIEKLLDSLHVYQGYHGVFFPNNGGREGFQMYLVAFIGGTLGVGFNFTALKLATALEGIVTLPALWWMARQVIGTDDEDARQLGHWVGIALAGLVAISSWHVMLSRLGLRIVLTPLATALVIGFLARCMRHNRMHDYLALGFVLGASIYFYQADRMLPILAAAGIGLAAIWGVRSPRDLLGLAASAFGFAALVAFPLLLARYLADVFEQSGHVNTREFGQNLNAYLPLLALVWLSLVALAVRVRRSDRLLQYGGGLLAVVVVALAVYVPMYHYTRIAPAEFWNRTRGRMFGDGAFVRTNSAGNLVEYEPSLSDQIRRIWDQRDVFVDNYKDALRMYNWQGDGAWINNALGRPALDAVAGGLLILGLVVWPVQAARRRRPEDWLLPVGVLVMLLPTALTLAYTIENPSFTRASGTIPEVFMLAALPVGLLGRSLSRVRWSAYRLALGRIAGIGLLAALLGYGIGPDWHNFFTDYRLNYTYSWKPYAEIAKPLHDFAHGEGSYGNAFMVAWPYWLDHRILGTMAGDIGWSNGLVTRDDLLSKIRSNQGTRYQYDPAKPLFVMYNTQDTDTAAYLTTLFPGGDTRLYQYSYQGPRDITLQGDFYIYVVWAGVVG